MSPRRPEPTDPEDVFVGALENYPPEFLACRENHVWPGSAPFVFVDVDREERQPRRGLRQFVERRKICQRCGMVRVDTFAITRTRGGHTSLHKIAGQYERPDGYAIEGIGNTRGLRDLLYGVAFDAQQARNGRRRS